MEKINFKPLQDRLLVKKIEGVNKTKGGIIIPDTAKETPTEGIVLEKGDGKYFNNGLKKKIELNIGDKIIFSKWSGSEIEINNVKYIVIKESEVLGKIIV